MKQRYLQFAALAGVLLVITATASVAKPVALATSISGKTTPVVEPFAELDRRVRITLDPDAEIEFLHYASCQTVLVRGGVLSFTDQRFQLRRGKILMTKRARCPKAVSLTGASQIGGIVLRSAPGRKNLRIAVAPTFVLVGPGAPKVEAIWVSLNGKKIVTAANPGRAFRWPADAPRLEKGQAYVVGVKLQGTPKPKTFNVEVKSRGGKSTLTLIRLD